MVMKASIFSQTHTGPSGPPRPLHNGPSAEAPPPVGFSQGSVEGRQAGLLLPAPSPLGPGPEVRQVRGAASSSPPELTASSVASSAKWRWCYSSHSVAGRDSIGNGVK